MIIIFSLWAQEKNLLQYLIIQKNGIWLYRFVVWMPGKKLLFSDIWNKNINFFYFSLIYRFFLACFISIYIFFKKKT